MDKPYNKLYECIVKEVYRVMLRARSPSHALETLQDAHWEWVGREIECREIARGIKCQEED